MPSSVHQHLRDAMRRGYVAAYRLLRSREAAEDACQEAAARALAAADRYDPERPFYPWYYRILRNHCLDVIAGRKRVALVGGSLDQHVPPTPADRTALGEALDNERSRELGAVIERLEPDLRRIIELRHFQDASYEEIANILSIPVGTVMSRLYRARKFLRAGLTRNAARGAQ